MNVRIEQKTVDIEVADDELSANVVPRTQEVNGKRLRLYYAIIGETSPLLSPLSLEYSFNDRTPAYRYDWLVGFTPVEPWHFDWRKDLNTDRAFCVQILIDCGDTGFSYTEVSAMLLGMQPSKDSTSWLERHVDKIGDSLLAVSDITQPINSTAASLIKMSALMSNFVKAGGKDSKNWFLYRFLDEKKHCCAVEWNIQKSVLEQYGPLLRGSLILTFHGAAVSNRPIRMLLRPRLALAKAGPLQYVPPDHQLEDKDPVILQIFPGLSEAAPE